VRRGRRSFRIGFRFTGHGKTRKRRRLDIVGRASDPNGLPAVGLTIEQLPRSSTATPRVCTWLNQTVGFQRRSCDKLPLPLAALTAIGSWRAARQAGGRTLPRHRLRQEHWRDLRQLGAARSTAHHLQTLAALSTICVHGTFNASQLCGALGNPQLNWPERLPPDDITAVLLPYPAGRVGPHLMP
jgi:hypothetical protein